MGEIASPPDTSVKTFFGYSFGIRNECFFLLFEIRIDDFVLGRHYSIQKMRLPLNGILDPRLIINMFFTVWQKKNHSKLKITHKYYQFER